MQLLSLLKELSLHPKNAEELKGLILQLAVQGKLTEKWRKQNPDIEPASELLKRIEAEKKQLIKEKKIKKEKLTETIKEEEVYFSIPITWTWERIGAIGNIFNGNSVNKSIKEAKYVGLSEGFPYIATKDVGYGFDSIDHDNGVRIPYDEPKFKTAKKGTVLICSEGGSAGKKMGILEEDCCFGNKLFALEQFGKIESVYILSLYSSPSFSKAFAEKMTGIIGGISRNNFSYLLVPLPPLEEQKAIVEVVNQLFAEIEQLEELTEERISLKEDFVTSALRNLTTSDNTATEWNFLKEQFSTFFTEPAGVKKLRETILQLAVQGKLTAKWRANNPNVEPASELLKRIEAEKQQLIKEKKIKKEKPLPEISDDEKPYELPGGWVWKRMGELCIKIIDGSHNPPPKQSTGIPMLSAQNIQNGVLTWNTNRYISQNDYTLEQKRNDIAKDDVFLTIVGTIGRTYVVTGEEDEFAIQRSVSQIRSLMNPYYMSFLLRSDYMFSYYDKNAKGTAQKGIYLNKLKLAPIVMPPIEEQQAIVEKLNSLMALCDALEQQIETSHTQVEQLMQSCLKEVYEMS